LIFIATEEQLRTRVFRLSNYTVKVKAFGVLVEPKILHIWHKYRYLLSQDRVLNFHQMWHMFGSTFDLKRFPMEFDKRQPTVYYQLRTAYCW